MSVQQHPLRGYNELAHLSERVATAATKLRCDTSEYATIRGTPGSGFRLYKFELDPLAYERRIPSN